MALEKIKEMDISIGRFEVEPREVYAVFRTESKSQDFVYSCLSLIKSTLTDLGGGVIWWRIRPEIACYDCGDGGSTFSKVYFRFATTPEFPKEFWKAIDSMKDNDARLECDERAWPSIAQTLGVPVEHLRKL